MSAGFLTDAPRGGEFLQEEIFGPVALVYRAAHIDEVLALANATPFGLGSSVWTRDEGEQIRFVREIDAVLLPSTGCSPLRPKFLSAASSVPAMAAKLGPFGLHDFTSVRLNNQTIHLVG